MIDRWFEVWADVTASPPYLLVLWPAAGGFEAVDPAKGSVEFRSDSYDDVVSWLLEDEYQLIRGRTEL
jgi:hypothetical protein